MTSSKQKLALSACAKAAAFIGVAYLAGCMPHGVTSGEGSKLADILMTLPSNKDASGSLIFDAYSVRIRTTTPQQKTSKDEACTSFEFGTADLTANLPTDGKISDLKVSDACDYVMTVELGYLEATVLEPMQPKLANGNGKMIPAADVRYSSDQPATKKFITIKGADLKAAKNGQYPVDVEVFKVDGRPEGPESLFSSGMADINLNIKIAGAKAAGLVANEVSEHSGATADAELKALLDANAGQRRIVVLFGMQGCKACNDQHRYMKEIVGALKADNLTVFVHHLSTDAPTGQTNWNLGDDQSILADFPYTYVYENAIRKEIKSTRGVALSKEQLTKLANGGVLD